MNSGNGPCPSPEEFKTERAVFQDACAAERGTAICCSHVPAAGWGNPDPRSAHGTATR